MFQIEIARKTEYADTNLDVLGEWVGFQRPLVCASEIKYASHDSRRELATHATRRIDLGKNGCYA